MKKLIRDRYDTIIDADRLETCTDKLALRSYLQDKLIEEIKELEDSHFEDVDEYADVLEVLFTLGEFHNISKSEIQARRIEKLYEKGGFTKGLILTRK